jgi:hypothetical protein
VLFPVYVALVAASHALPDIVEAPMSLVPGTQFAADPISGPRSLPARRRPAASRSRRCC